MNNEKKDERKDWYRQRRQRLDQMKVKLEKFSKLPPMRQAILTNFDLNFMLRQLILDIKTNNNILEILEDGVLDAERRLYVLSPMLISLAERIQSIEGLDTDEIKEEIENIKKELKEKVRPAVDLIEEAKNLRKRWLEENR